MPSTAFLDSSHTASLGHTGQPEDRRSCADEGANGAFSEVRCGTGRGDAHHTNRDDKEAADLRLRRDLMLDAHAEERNAHGH